MNSSSLKVTPRANGTLAYDVRFRLDGKSKSFRFNNQAGAEAWMTTYRKYGYEVARAQILSKESGPVPTVEEYATAYIDGLSGVGGKTIDNYRMFIRRWIAPVMGGIPITAVKPETVASWVNGMADGYDGREPSSEKSMKNRHGFLYAMFEHARDREIITRNPCKGTRIARTIRPQMMVLTHEQFARVQSFIPDHYKPFTALLIMTGLRFSEATALRTTDFNLADEFVRVTKAWKYSSKRRWYEGPPKTAMSVRDVSLPIDWREQVLPTVLACETEYVFTNLAGKPIRQSTFFKAVWDPARRKAFGLKPQAEAKRDGESTDAPFPLPRLHDLRHSHASWMIAGGENITYVQHRLGHESVETTTKIYAKVAPDFMAVTARGASKAIAGAFTEPSQNTLGNGTSTP